MEQAGSCQGGERRRGDWMKEGEGISQKYTHTRHRDTDSGVVMARRRGAWRLCGGGQRGGWNGKRLCLRQMVA